MRVDGFSIHSCIFSNIMKEWKEEIWEKHVPYMVQRKHFDQTFSKSLMVQVHGGAKASAEEGRYTSSLQKKLGGEKEKNEKQNEK